jgi:dTDP-4-amino-4,6-dideoxygalactose transaminase
MSTDKMMTKPSRIYLSPPHMSPAERELLLEAFDSNWIAPLGPHVEAFEREFAEKVGVKYAVALASGTSALHLALLILGIKPGDDVATSTLTFVATANAIRYVGANPVFIDSQECSWNLDPELLAIELREASLRGRPIKAVLAVDILGQCADYDAIQALCQEYQIPLIEDAAESLGATYQNKPAGGFGDIGCFSFNGNKIITTSSGGMLVTSNKEWADRARFLATQARDPFPHYEHSVVGYNYRMSNLLAAIGRGQLSVLDERVQSRQSNYEFYEKTIGTLPGIVMAPELPAGRSTHWLSCITVDPELFGATREDIRLALEQENIESRPVWKPMHMQPVYATCRARGGSVAEKLFTNGLCLPSGSNLTTTDLNRIVNVIQSVGQTTSVSAHQT